MVVYKVFYKDFELKKGEFMGMLIERRRDLRGKNQIESGLKWARLTFGSMLRDSRTMFVVPRELNPGSDAEWIIEKAVFTRGELLEMTKPIDRETRGRREEELA